MTFSDVYEAWPTYSGCQPYNGGCFEGGKVISGMQTTKVVTFTHVDVRITTHKIPIIIGC